MAPNLNWTEILADAGIPEPPGYVETCLRVKESNVVKAAAVERAKADKVKKKEEKVVKAGMGLRQRRRYL